MLKLIATFFFGCAVMAWAAIPSHAATFTVTETSDNDCTDNDCDLQSALTAAQDNDEADTINIAAGTYDASGATFSYLADATALSEENFALTIEGAGVGQTIIDGGMLARGLSIITSGLSDDSAASTTVRHISFVDGSGANNGGNLLIGTTQAPVTVEHCSFTGGKATNNGGGLGVLTNDGAGIIRHNNFVSNDADNNGGGAAFLGFASGSVTLENNIFDGNHAGNNGGGAGMLTFDTGSATLINNIAFGNSADNSSGGLAGMLFGTGGTAVFTHNTVHDNSSNLGGGLRAFSTADSQHIDIYNNIAWGNTATTSGGDIDIFNSDDDANNIGNTVTIHNNNYSDLSEDCNSGSCTSTISSMNNLDVDPLFVDASAGDLHLQSTSPLIDQGDPAAPELPTEDIDGDPRTLGSAPDMGADEVTACGDGSINTNAGEVCDDGNTAAGDGCDATCQVEADFDCTGEPSVCTPTGDGGTGDEASSGGCSLIRY